MTKIDYIRNIMHTLMRSFYRKLEYDKKLESKIDWEGAGIFPDLSMHRQRRTGWYAWLTVDGVDYGASIDIESKLCPLTPDELATHARSWTIVFKHVFDNKLWSEIYIDPDFEKEINGGAGC